jgi:hypothetical protein
MDDSFRPDASTSRNGHTHPQKLALLVLNPDERPLLGPAPG